MNEATIRFIIFASFMGILVTLAVYEALLCQIKHEKNEKWGHHATGSLIAGAIFLYCAWPTNEIQVMIIFMALQMALAAIISIHEANKCIAKYKKNEKWGRHAVCSLAPGIAVLGCSWLLAGTRVIYEIQCAKHAGLRIKNPIDARNDGVYLSKHSSQNSSENYTKHPYAKQAFDDLVSGRIAYFEGLYEQNNSKFVKISLAEKHSKECILTRKFRAQDLLDDNKIPEGKCIAEEKVSQLSSKYELNGYHKNGDHKEGYYWLTDRKSGQTVASYGRNYHDDLYSGKMYCPENEENIQHPFLLTPLALKDSSGKTLSMADYIKTSNDAKEMDEKPRHTRSKATYITPAIKNQNNKCPTINPDSFTETHRIDIGSGTNSLLPRTISLGTNLKTPTETKVVINRPGEKVVIILEGRSPIIWDIYRTTDTGIAGVIAKGNYPQAVLGVENSTPMFFYFDQYSPIPDCQPPFDLLYKIRPMSEFKKDHASTVVIGQPDFAERELFHSESRLLDDYMIR